MHIARSSWTIASISCKRLTSLGAIAPNRTQSSPQIATYQLKSKAVKRSHTLSMPPYTGNRRQLYPTTTCTRKLFIPCVLNTSLIEVSFALFGTTRNPAVTWNDGIVLGCQQVIMQADTGSISKTCRSDWLQDGSLHGTFKHRYRSLCDHRLWFTTSRVNASIYWKGLRSGIVLLFVAV